MADTEEDLMRWTAIVFTCQNRQSANCFQKGMLDIVASCIYNDDDISSVYHVTGWKMFKYWLSFSYSPTDLWNKFQLFFEAKLAYICKELPTKWSVLLYVRSSNWCISESYYYYYYLITELNYYQKLGSIHPDTFLLAVDDPRPNIGSGSAVLNALLCVSEHLAARSGCTVKNIPSLHSHNGDWLLMS